MNGRDGFHFECRTCKTRFTAASPALAQSLPIVLGAATLGAWWVGSAFARLWRLYRLSVCPHCEKRSRRLLLIFLFLAAGTVELSYTIYYFTVQAPQQIVRDVSMASLPKDFDPKAPIGRENLWSVAMFLWLVAILPGAGTYISSHWPYLLLGWFSVVVFVGFGLPSIYLKK